MPDFATTDLILAIAHHLLVFALAAVLAFEIGAVRRFLRAEVVFFALVPVFAAAMARGYGAH